MIRSIACRGITRIAWGLLALIAAVTVVACGDVNFDLTRPVTPIYTSSGVGLRTLEISGSLTAAHGTCFEATVLYDGLEIAGSRVVCSDAEGCRKFNLTAVTSTDSGRHTISLRIIRQSRELIDYRAEIAIRISREGLPFVLPISPEPVRATLQAGQEATFEIEFFD